MLGRIKSAAAAVAGAAGDKLAVGAEKLMGPLGELAAASGDLEELGYRAGQIELVCSLPPRLVVFLTRKGSASPEAYQAILARHAGSHTIRTVVGLLQMADRMAERVKLQGRRCSQLALELGVPPSIRLIYDPAPGGAGTIEGGSPAAKPGK
jgi:hypothetical protein